jgi:hypothetical protein
MQRIIVFVTIGIIFLWVSHFVPVRGSQGSVSVECQEALTLVDGDPVDASTVHFVQTGFPLRTFQDYNHEFCKDGSVPIGQWIRFIINAVFWVFVVFVVMKNLDGAIFKPPYLLILTAITILVTIFGFINIFGMYG